MPRALEHPPHSVMISEEKTKPDGAMTEVLMVLVG